MSYQPQGYQQQQQQQPHYPPPPPHPPQQPQQQQQHHPQQQQQQQQQQSSTDSGSFPGGSYNIAHRDTNAILNVNLQPGGTVRSKSGAMIHMSGTIQLQGNIKFSMKKLFTGGRMSESTYTGPGRLALGPTLMGDIITLHVDGRTPWTVGKDTFLACTPDVAMETKSQGISKSMFSGEDLFVYRVGGQGLLWLTSFGAVDRLDLQPGEQHIVDNGHLVAWSCDYRIEKAGGGAMSSLKTGEGLVCRFTGPGAVYVQTRNMDEFDSYISSRSSS
ncbi:mitochondrial biogenesis protein family AIM24 [Metarhizium robertsii]|uniref:Altered inheritance of mitochondria protein 24, mitochondrial n=1 Tax=Metarhizium robertsii TaxID=568076 RepID=A0A0A1V786_9HYPO|nr:mitochondrial biogenesis protein family AIM24 [Metarhizium robertsii]